MVSELETFLEDWKADPHGVKPLFLEMYGFLKTFPDVELDYKGRAGISHSLRARHRAQKERDLFVLVDIIDDDPEARWLSVCFYADLVSDPEERGDVVPGGLDGEDACCFDIETPENDACEYMLARLGEAVTACK